MEKILFTSESVTEGHPDKMCDAISDAILDALMEKDPMSRVACETATTTGLVLVMNGEPGGMRNLEPSRVTSISRTACAMLSWQPSRSMCFTVTPTASRWQTSPRW